MNTTGAKLTKGQEVSPAWQRASEVIAMYKAGIGFTSIARKLAISKRITREILIKRGHWKPDPRRNGVARKGLGGLVIGVMTGEHRRNKLALIRLTRRMDRALRRGQRRANPMHGMNTQERYAWRYDNDHAFRMQELIRRRMRKIITGEGTSKRQLALLGCTREEFIAHIQRQFTKGMTWENNGTGENMWHLDHIVPCSAFDQTDSAQRAVCWHYTNLRPMWSRDNMAKSDKIDHTNAQLGLPL